MKRTELTKTFRMISNWKKNFGRHIYAKIFQRFNCKMIVRINEKFMEIFWNFQISQLHLVPYYLLIFTHYHNPHLQVGETYSYLFNSEQKIGKSFYLSAHFVPTKELKQVCLQDSVHVYM